MPKYRGFEKELPGLSGYHSSPMISGETIDRFNLGHLAAAFSGPRRTTYIAPAPVAVSAPAYVPTIYPGVTVPGKLQPIIKGDIRPITAQIDPVSQVDDMAPEEGIPGVDEGGAVPYGDPRVTKTVTVKEGGNAGWIIAAVLGTLLLGG